MKRPWDGSDDRPSKAPYPGLFASLPQAQVTAEPMEDAETQGEKDFSHYSFWRIDPVAYVDAKVYPMSMDL
jgi:hypothetical protein